MYQAQQDTQPGAGPTEGPDRDDEDEGVVEGEFQEM